MNHNTTLLATGWVDTAFVVAILLAATVFLIVLIVRFFRGQITCSCSRKSGRPPAGRSPSNLIQIGGLPNRKPDKPT